MHYQTKMALEKAAAGVGKKFNKLTPIKSFFNKQKNCFYYLCRCDCGKEKEIYQNNVLRGKVKSCGCLRGDISCRKQRHLSHGKSRTRIYGTWTSMKRRCMPIERGGHKHYGGRGISVCKRWEKFENFYKDMGDIPSGKSLDRIDNNRNYSKENCRWATKLEQANNTRSNRLITFNGKTQSISQWSRETGIPLNVYYKRIRNGKYSIDEFLFAPVGQRGPKTPLRNIHIIQICRMCKKEKNGSEFHNSKCRKIGIDTKCKECTISYNKPIKQKYYARLKLAASK